MRNRPYRHLRPEMGRKACVVSSRFASASSTVDLFSCTIHDDQRAAMDGQGWAGAARMG